MYFSHLCDILHSRVIVHHRTGVSNKGKEKGSPGSEVNIEKTFVNLPYVLVFFVSKTFKSETSIKTCYKQYENIAVT